MLANFANMLTEEENVKVKDPCESFLRTHDYFKFVYASLKKQKKNHILEYISLGKGVISYEKIRDLESSNIVTKNGELFEKIRFFSDLKNKKQTHFLTKSTRKVNFHFKH